MNYSNRHPPWKKNDLDYGYKVVGHVVLENVKFVPDNVLAQGITRHTKLFIGKVFLKLKVGQLTCLDHYYVMPPKAMILSKILGTPWQRKYKDVPNWETNSIKIT